MTKPVERYTLKKGEVFNDLVEVRHYDADNVLVDDFDFTDMVLEVDLRDPSGKEIIELTTEVVENIPGKLVMQISATAEQTKTFPLKKLVGDLKFSREAPEFGPYVPAMIEVTVLAAFTK